MYRFTGDRGHLSTPRPNAHKLFVEPIYLFADVEALTNLELPIHIYTEREREILDDFGFVGVSSVLCALLSHFS